MLWTNFLHIYQPPTQKEIWVKRIADESYRKVLAGISGIPRARLTLNINGVLCELLEKYRCGDVIQSIKKLLREGKIELTGSAKYHAFLPLLPDSEIERQIRLNEESLEKYFGSLWKKSGFFPPEMAYSKRVAEIAARMGYKWIIVDELAKPPGKKLSHETVYEIEGIPGFSVFFRERNLSFIILSARAGAISAILRFAEDRLDKNEYAITAMDGETFGHHRPGLENLLFDLLKEEKIQPAMVSDLCSAFSKREKIEPRESTWAATKKDMRDGTPFSRWASEQNNIQKNQWALTKLAIDTVNKNGGGESRELLDRALHSDQYWWASAKPWWSLEMIERGANELHEVVNISPASTENDKEKAEELYKGIIYTAFKWQRSGLVDIIARRADEDVQERLELKEKFFLTKDEYENMIKTLEEQVQLAANSKEYHRAAMIQDRVRELKEEMNKTSI